MQVTHTRSDEEGEKRIHGPVTAHMSEREARALFVCIGNTSEDARTGWLDSRVAAGAVSECLAGDFAQALGSLWQGLNDLAV